MAIDLTEMSLDELVALEKDIQKAKVALEKRRLADARKALEEAAKEFGMTVEEVMSARAAPKSGQKSAPKYANPANPTQTWTGRGRQPAWYRAAIEAGTDPKDLAI